MQMSRNESDASHTLFVVRRPERPLRYLYVNERSGEALVFNVERRGEGATVARSGGPCVHLAPLSADQTLERNEADGGQTRVEIDASGLRFDLPDGEWVVAVKSNGGLFVLCKNRKTRLIVQKSETATDTMSETYDVWARGNPAETERALGLAVEALVALRLVDVLSLGVAG